MDEVVRRYRVQGLVQGVGFRWFVREAARALNLHGWVRNEPGGDVLVEVGGSVAAVDRLVERLAEGPPLSQVVAVQAEPADASRAGDLPVPFAVHR